MGKPITHEYTQGKGIFKFFPEGGIQGTACVVPQAGVTADDNGNKIVKAGTPYPEAGKNCLGLLVHDVDVTQGDAPGTYVNEGTIDPEKVDMTVITAATLKALPKITIYGRPYAAE